MKIAMIGHKRIPGREGGVEIVVSELARRMAALGHRVDVYNRWDLGAPYGRVAFKKPIKNLHVHQIPTPKSSALNAFVYSVLATLRALFGRYTIIHFHAIGSCAMIFLPHFFRIPNVATVHGLDWQRAKWNKFASFYLKFGEKMAARYADEIIVLSRGNQRYFFDTYQRETTFVPNGMDFLTPPAPDIIKSKYGLDKGDYVLFLARIVPEKGLHYLLEAFASIETTKRLIVAGKIDISDAYHQKIVAMAEHDSRVELIGFVQGNEWAELFGNCFVYVLPSDVEGMPISLLEALGFGARCLVSDIDENVDAGKGCVDTFEHSNPESLREALSRILNNPEGERENPDRDAWENWDTVTDKTLKLYQQAIQSRHSKSRKNKE